MLGKFGCIFSEKEAQALFHHYDTTKSGVIKIADLYEHFSSISGKKIPNTTLIFEIKR